MSNGRWHLPTFRLITLAAVAGVAAGAIAVYVKGDLSGNNARLVAATDESGSDVCEAKSAAAKKAGDAATGKVAAMLPADPPQSLKNLAFNGPDGTPITLADLSGKTVLMNLWATWCAPCRAEMPELDVLQKERGGDDFEVVAVNVDTGDDEKPKAFLAETGIESLRYYRENSLALFNDLKKRSLALGLPVTLLIDDEGCLLAHMNGPAEWASDDAKKLVKAVMGGE